MVTDSFVLSVNTKDIIKDLTNFEELFDFSNLSENHELISKKKQKVIEKFKVETPKIFWHDKLIFWEVICKHLNVEMIEKVN